MTVLFEILFLLVLLIANGVFAMSEIAVVSARKTRLQQAALRGDRKAAAAFKLAEHPDRFLSTVQIGITLVGILAGAFGGATIAAQLDEQLEQVPALAPYSEALGLFAVVLVITYLSLVVGELVPKRIGLNNPERIAAMVARPMNLLSRATAPAVWLLGVSTGAILKLIGAERADEPPVTNEEVSALLEQGRQAGVFEASETNIIDSVLRLDERRVGELMTPRLDIEWLDTNDSPEEMRRVLADTHYSRFPVCRGGLDNALGVIKAKNLLGDSLAGRPLDLQAHISAPLFVPETQTALQVLEMFKRAHTHMAFVVDERGAFEGLVTTNDLLEAIVGDVTTASRHAEPPDAIERADGSWLLDGALPVGDFKRIFGVRELPGESERTYQTIAGFILLRLGRIPKAGDHFTDAGIRFEIMDMDGNRIDKVLAQRNESEN